MCTSEEHPRRGADQPAVLQGEALAVVVELAEQGQLALHAAVDVEEIWDLLPKLKAAGASSSIAGTGAGAIGCGSGSASPAVRSSGSASAGLGVAGLVANVSSIRPTV